MHGERPVAGGGKAVHAQAGKVNLAVADGLAFRANQGTGVEKLVLLLSFEQPEDRPDAEFATQAGQQFRTGPRDRLRLRPGFFLALEGVAGQGTFREDDEAGTLFGRRAQLRLDQIQITMFVAETAVHLDAGDFPRCHFVPNASINVSSGARTGVYSTRAGAGGMSHT